MLQYFQRRGRIVPVRRGVYAAVPEGVSPDMPTVDAYLVCSRLTPDAVLAYHTALELHGKAYSVFERLHYLTARRPATVRFRSLDFKAVRFPTRLVAKGEELFGVVEVDRIGLDVRVTDLERTFVDVLDRPDLSGGWEEVWRSLEMVEFFDLDRVIQYVELLENATTAAKVGFYLDRHRDELMVHDDHLAALRKLRPGQPLYMDRSRRSDGRLVSDWNLIVPDEVLDRTWEQVL